MVSNPFASSARMPASGVLGRLPRPDVAVCYGTRPQVIKVARLLPALRRRFSVLAIDTGQHYDAALRDGLYRDLGVPDPSVFLGVGAAHPVEQTARMVAASMVALRRHRPRAVIVIGDTNSTLACGIAASQLDIPLVHVEAGLRSGQLEMAEERNRLAVDAMASLLCAPSARAAQALASERRDGRVAVTGDVARDVLEHSCPLAPARDDVAGLPVGPYILATMHRAELVDRPAILREVLDALDELPHPVVLPLHPRTQLAAERAGLLGHPRARTIFRPPLGYLETLTAIQHASIVVTDSGGVQREAYWLGRPCVTLRETTEWIETVELGANRLVAPGDVASRLSPAVAACDQETGAWSRDAYGTGDAAEQVAAEVVALVGPGRPSFRRQRSTIG